MFKGHEKQVSVKYHFLLKKKGRNFGCILKSMFKYSPYEDAHV